MWDLPQSHLRVRATGCWPHRAPWFVVLLATERRVCDGGYGEQWRVRHLWELWLREMRTHSGIAYPREYAEPDAARGAADLFQEPTESQRSRGDPWYLSGERW